MEKLIYTSLLKNNKQIDINYIDKTCTIGKGVYPYLLPITGTSF